MRLGLATTDLDRMPIAVMMDKIAHMGYEVTQLSFDSVQEADFIADDHIEIPAVISPDTLRRIRQAAQTSGVQIISVNGTFNAAHPDKAVREEGIRRFERFAAAVAELGAPMASLCTGTRSLKRLWHPHPDNDTPEAFADTADTVARLCRIAEKEGILLGVETEASNTVNSAEKARKLLDEIGSPHLKIILDAANLFRPGQARRDNVIHVMGDAFDRLGSDIISAHGKDILEGPGVQFCPTGEGIVDFPYFLQRLRECNYQGDFLLHGIYDEAKMVPCRKFIEELL